MRQRRTEYSSAGIYLAKWERHRTVSAVLTVTLWFLFRQPHEQPCTQRARRGTYVKTCTYIWTLIDLCWAVCSIKTKAPSLGIIFNNLRVQTAILAQVNIYASPRAYTLILKY